MSIMEIFFTDNDKMDEKIDPRTIKGDKVKDNKHGGTMETKEGRTTALGGAVCYCGEPSL